MHPACILAFCTGFISLSMEILWIRLFSFANLTKPQAFGFVLALYLVGIAFGAMIGKRICYTRVNLWLASGVSLMLAGIVNIAGPWVYAAFRLSPHPYWAASSMMVLTALLCSIVFPIVHHLGASNTTSTGRDISKVYVSNIIGATLGPLFTGLLLLTVFTTQQAFIIISAFTFFTALYCLYSASNKKIIYVSCVGLSLLAASALTLNANYLIFRFAGEYLDKRKIRRIIENQHGVIVAYKYSTKEDIITGNNVYDGTTNLDPVYDTNGISRVILLSALVDHPRKILMIGLSVGSWLKIITSFTNVDTIDVVEINPGYIDLIHDYPAQASALKDPRVHMYFDDGRRWLKAHPDNRYDLVIMNTSFYWRVYSTLLLSQDFMRIIKSHMNPDAVFEFNATFSPDVAKTAESVFKYSYLYEGVVIAADFDWRKKLHSTAAARKLASLMLDGKLLYPPGFSATIDKQLKHTLRQSDDWEALLNFFNRKAEIVTDDNVIIEFKHGRNLIE